MSTSNDPSSTAEFVFAKTCEAIQELDHFMHLVANDDHAAVLLAKLKGIVSKHSRNLDIRSSSDSEARQSKSTGDGAGQSRQLPYLPELHG